MIGWLMNGEMNWNEAVVSSSRYYPAICLEKLENIENLQSGQDLNHELHKYECKVLPLG
jgi:hypothetical protein